MAEPLLQGVMSEPQPRLERYGGIEIYACSTRTSAAREDSWPCCGVAGDMGIPSLDGRGHGS